MKPDELAEQLKIYVSEILDGNRNGNRSAWTASIIEAFCVHVEKEPDADALTHGPLIEFAELEPGRKARIKWETVQLLKREQREKG